MLSIAGAVGAMAQEDPAAGDVTYGDLLRMIQDLEGRVGRLGQPVPAETIESLQEQVDEAVRRLSSRSEENTELRDKASNLDSQLKAATEARDQLTAQVAELKAEYERKLGGLDVELRRAKATIEATQTSLAAARRTNADKERELERLGRQLEAVVIELANLNKALDASEARNREQERRIADVDAKLARALASKVEDMARYRSEFFGRLREALGDHPDIRIVGDRFVFQSEVLFQSGDPTLGEEGKKELGHLAETLIAVAAKIPANIDWVLRVDGHTDRLPIHNQRFASNWDLSTARAVSVVEFLIGRGVPPARLAAAGFGEFHPLDPRDDEIAYRRNRRIEFKLTQK